LNEEGCGTRANFAHSNETQTVAASAATQLIATQESTTQESIPNWTAKNSLPLVQTMEDQTQGYETRGDFAHSIETQTVAASASTQLITTQESIPNWTANSLPLAQTMEDQTPDWRCAQDQENSGYEEHAEHTAKTYLRGNVHV
jgi:hypothetical protein